MSRSDGFGELMSQSAFVEHGLVRIAKHSDGDFGMEDKYRQAAAFLRKALDELSCDFFHMIGGPLHGTTQAMPTHPHSFVPDSQGSTSGYRMLAGSKLFIHNSISDAAVVIALDRLRNKATVIQKPGCGGLEAAQIEKAALEEQGYSVTVVRDDLFQRAANHITAVNAPYPHVE